MTDKARALRKDRHTPQLDAATQDILWDWFARKLNQLEKAIATTKEMIKLHNADWVQQQLAYYQNALSAAKWLRWSLMPKRGEQPDVQRDATPES